MCGNKTNQKVTQKVLKDTHKLIRVKEPWKYSEQFTLVIHKLVKMQKQTNFKQSFVISSMSLFIKTIKITF